MNSEWLGMFVTAKLKGLDDCRQGWVVELSPLIIQGLSGTFYTCEGEPTLVVNPPGIGDHKKVLIERDKVQHEIAKGLWALKQYQKIQDFVIQNRLYKGCPDSMSHADIVIALARKALDAE